METARLIERRGNPDDRRSVKIHLTKLGKETGLEAKNLIEEANREFLADFTENEKQDLRALVFKLREKISR